MTKFSALPLLDDSVLVKLEQADRHLEDFKANVSGLSNPDRSRIHPQFNNDFTELEYSIFFRRPHPARRWSALIGDILFNLRCTLDHMTYALAASEHQVIPPPDQRTLEFPIADTPDDWKKVKRYIRSVGEKPREIIENEQPCNRGNPLLSLIGRVNNADKHRAVMVAPVALTKVESIPLRSKDGRVMNVKAQQGPLILDARVLILTFAEPSPNYRAEPSFGFGVLFFDGREWKPAIQTLTDCRDEVVRLIDLLKPYVV